VVDFISNGVILNPFQSFFFLPMKGECFFFPFPFEEMKDERKFFIIFSQSKKKMKKKQMKVRENGGVQNIFV